MFDTSKLSKCGRGRKPINVSPDLTELILKAHEEGNSVRSIAEASGLSRYKVQSLINKYFLNKELK